MNRFAALLDRLAYEPRRNAKLRLMQEFFSATPDPERGFALAAMTGGLSFREAKAGLIRGLVEARVDPVLFRMSYDYVGDLAETAALVWPAAENPSPPAGRVARPQAATGGARRQGASAFEESGGVDRASPPDPADAGPPSPQAGREVFGIGHNDPPPHAPTLSEVVETLRTLGRGGLPAQVEAWLDALDETGRWALIKLITGALRVGVSARLAKTAVANLAAANGLAPVTPDAVEEVWHGLAPPYLALFAWVEGHGPAPASGNPAPFRPPMLSHPIEEEADLAPLHPDEFRAEWKWDGIRVQLAGGRDPDGSQVARVYSRTGEDITGAFPDLADAITFEGALDGELLILREGRVQSFNVLQQRLNRKAVTGKLLEEFPAHVRAYDLLAADGEDLRPRSFAERRPRLEAFVARLDHARIDLSPLVPFADWPALAAARADPASAGAGADAEAVEGVMLKRRDSAYVPGRPKGPWWKWKREPYRVDAVMMYAQRGHGKRSSFYSDYTFGVWREGEGGEELVPVGKAYHGITDEELGRLDRYVRHHTVNRFGPVREVAFGPDKGLVLEIAFEGLQRSTRHKSGVAMRFPRIGRIRWDKPAAEADRLDTLERILARGEAEVMPGAVRAKAS